MNLQIFRLEILSAPFMKVMIFKTLAKMNKVILPSYKDRDLTKLSMKDKMIVGWKIWVTKNALGN